MALGSSYELNRYPASALVQRVFMGRGPAYVCVTCGQPFLRPNADAELWRRAVCSGVISDAESVLFCTSVPTWKCYSVDEDEDNNGVCLRLCIVCCPRGERI